MHDRVKCAFAIGLALTTWGCESGPQPVEPAAAAQQTASLAENAVFVGTARTHSHFAAASDLQVAIADGRLVDARDAARSLASEEVSDPRWQPHMPQLRAAATSIAEAGDLAAAGRQLGKLGAACGTCHAALAADVGLTSEPLPRDDGSLASQMRRHAWAAGQLWEGLVGPSDASWRAGAQELATARLDLVETVHEKPNAEVFELAEELRGDAARAAETSDREARAAVYADMMTACVGCHQITRPHPVARR